MSIVLEKKDAGEWWCQLYFEEGKPYRMKVKFNVRTTTTTSTVTTAAATDDMTQADDFNEGVTEDPEFYTDEEYRKEWDDNNPTKLKQATKKDADSVDALDDSGYSDVTEGGDDEQTESSDGAGDTSSSNGGVQEALSNFDEPLSKGKGGKQKSSSDDGGKQSISSSSSGGSQSISSSSSGGGSQSISSSSSGGTQSISSSSSGGGKTSVSVSGGGEKSISVSGDGHKKVAVDGQVVHDSYDDYERKRL